MNEVKWIKIATDIFDDEKILLIESMPDADALIVIWLKLLVLSGKCNSSGVLMMSDKIPYSEEMLASIFRRPLNTIRLAITTFEKFGMVEIIDDVIALPNWEKHQSLDKLEKRKEYMKNYMRERRQKQKLLVTDANNKREFEPNDFNKLLTADEIHKLYQKYDNASILIDECQFNANENKRVIKNAYKYIQGYARNKEWPKK